MRITVTGLNGTVAPVLAAELTRAGHDVAGWDRAAVPIDDAGAMRGFFDRERPEWFCHVATGPPAWAEAVAGECAKRGVGFLYTSSVSVFSEKHIGPVGVDATPDAADDYGRYKIECEERVRGACPAAVIVRLGWQIGEAPGSNNMVDYLHREVAAAGRIELSRRWFPACSFLDDTAEAIRANLGRLPPGVYHLDGNPGLSLYQIGAGLNKLHRWGWKIVATDEPERNHLMVDERVQVRAITERLGGLEINN